MSIKPKNGPRQGSSISPPRAEERRIFICYPRSILGDVEAFHDVLRERLGVFGRNYEIFRDIGPDKRERIQTGTDWKEVLREKLEASRCCLIVLIPAIFQSVECAEEVEYFQRLIAEDPSRFFYPVDFAEIDEAIEKHHASGNAIASLLVDGRLHRFPFSKVVLASDQKAYKREVHKIAEEIDRRFSAVREEGGLQVGGLLDTFPPPPPPRPFLRQALPFIVAALVIVAGGAYWLTSPELVVWSDVTTPIELVRPTQSFASFGSTAEKAALLDPGELKIGENQIAHIREATIDGKVWYEIELGNGDKRYLTKDSIPVWREVDGDLGIIRPIEALAGPYAGADPIDTLKPGDLARLQDYGTLRKADISDETWLRVPQRQGADVFFVEESNRANLAQWSPLDGCLRLIDNARSVGAPVNGHPLNSLYKGETIDGKRKIQMARIDGEEWFRFRRSPEDAFEYLSAKNVEKIPCMTE